MQHMDSRRRKSVPSQDDIEPPDRQSIRLLVGKLTRLINKGLQTWNEASKYSPPDPSPFFDKVNRLKKQVHQLQAENSLLERNLAEIPGGSIWKRNTEAAKTKEMRERLVVPVREITVELRSRLTEIEQLVAEELNDTDWS